MRRPVVVYLLLAFLWVILSKVPGFLGAGPQLDFVLGRVANPILMTAITLALAGRSGRLVDTLRFGAPSRPLLWLVLAVSLMPAAVVVWHGARYSFAPLASSSAALLLLRVALNQAWLEELQARGYLLGALSRSGAEPTRAVVISALTFGGMHLLQFLIPPITVEGLVSGLVLVVLTVPIGLVFGWLTLRAGSIWPAVVLHMFVDSTILCQKLLPTFSYALIVVGTYLPVLILALVLFLSRSRSHAQDIRTRPT